MRPVGVRERYVGSRVWLPDVRRAAVAEDNLLCGREESEGTILVLTGVASCQMKTRRYMYLGRQYTV